MKGKLIVVDGVEGGGKSTCLSVLERHIRTTYGQEVIRVREPGGTMMAEEIRDLILKQRDERVTPNTELLLMFASRSQLLENTIIPAVHAGKVVLSDRFSSATRAYQCSGRGEPVEKFLSLKDIVQGSFEPDLTFILDLDPMIGLDRAKKRGELDRFEMSEISFFNRVRNGFLEQAHECPERFRVVDAEQSAEDVQRAVLTVYDRWTETCNAGGGHR